MYKPSRNERRQVERTLKDFAFEQSPMFEQDLVQSMSVEHSYELRDDWQKQLPKEIVDQDPEAEVFSPDSTTVTVGFEASRIPNAYQKRPIYRFAARLIFSTFQLPDQIKMSDQDWLELAYNLDEYFEEDIEEMSKAEIIDMLNENMIGCEKYRRVDYEYDTLQGTIQVNDEAGYLIADNPYGVIETHPGSDIDLIYSDDNPLGNITADAATNLSVDDVKFEQAVSELREHYEDHGDLMTHQDKFNEFNYLLQCIKTRRIKLQ